MAQFLSQFGVELVLLLYGILTTILNVVTFRRTGKLTKTNWVVDTSNTDKQDKQDKLVRKIEKARDKLGKLLDQATLSDGEE